ncbi:MAG TPA: hypothetical protein EYH31_02070 [Anaerolineae bacterium]|nr:hypothetical protein [Anaerolineae bacterium]
MLTILAVGVPAVWAVLSWVVSWIPYGFLLAAALFSLVIATYIVLAVCWVVGMVYALQAKAKPVPIVGGWAQRLPIDESPNSA